MQIHMLNFSRLVRTLALISIMAMAINPSVANDTWWHLRAGEEILERGEILKSDPFSLTRQGQPWIYPGWLSQVVLFKIFDWFSYAGLNIFTGVMIFIAFIFVWRVLDGRDLLKAFLLLLAVSASSVYWSARPQIISFALSGVTIFLLERWRNGKSRDLWFFPLVMILWVNVHGGFAIGFIFVGLYLISKLIDVAIELIDDRTRFPDIWQEQGKYITTGILVILVSLVAVILNPNGAAMLIYPFKTISIQALQDYIAEWQTPDFHGRETLPFLAMFFMTWISLALSRRKIFAVDVLVPLVLGYLSLTAGRNIALFSLATLPILFRHTSSITDHVISKIKPGEDFSENLMRILNWTLLILFIVAASLKIARELPDEINVERVLEQIPVEAFELIEREQFAGELFNSYNWGGYVVWKLYPEYLSFVDGRTDLFGDEILDQYFNIWLAGSGWEQELMRWEIQLVMIEPHAPLSQALKGSGWILQFEDSRAVVLTRPPK